jgi:ankyrin repeat protein
MHVQRRNSRPEEFRHFLNAVTTLCDLTIRDCSGFESALDLTLIGYTNKASNNNSLKEASKVNVWLPIFWAAIAEKDAEKHVTTLLDNNADAIDMKLPLTDATIGHFVAGSSNCTIEVLKVLFARRPDLATSKDVHGNLMIHYAAMHGASVETLRYLLELNPTSIKAKGRGGNMPAQMSVTAASASSIQSLKYLLEQDSSVLTAVNSNGETPLHLSWSCWGNSDLLAVPRMLFAMNPEAAFMKNGKGKLPLFSVCESVDFTTAETFALFEEVLQLYQNRGTPDGLDYFLFQSKAGDTFLHAACMNKGRSAPQLILRLLELSPTAAGISNEDNSCPLHMALRSLTKHSDTVEAQKAIEALIRAYPEACLEEDETNDSDVTPLHIAAAHWPLSIVKAVLAGAVPKENIPLAFNYYLTPLLSAIEGDGNLEVIRYLHELFPDAVKAGIEEKEDTFPLYSAVRTGRLDVVKLVYEMYPKAIETTNPIDLLPIHECVKSYDMDWSLVTPTSPAADIIRFLLSKYPAGVLVKDDECEYPVDILESQTAENYLNRLGYRAAVSVDPGSKYGVLLRELNYEERRGAMYLLYSKQSVPASSNVIASSMTARHDAFDPATAASTNVSATAIATATATTTAMATGTVTATTSASSLLAWLLLRERGIRELQQSVLSFL